MKQKILLLLFFLFLTACQSKTTEVPEDIQSISQPMAENILTSLLNDDYTSFQRDFSEKMLSAIDESTFTSIQQSIFNTLGEYQDLTYQQTTLEDGYLVSYYAIQFSGGKLSMRLVLAPEAPYQVEGFWFPDFPTE
ncbi:MAG TPA: hypothetical protein DCK95_06575 [Anaerolineaceae bacterium]|nr:hypothetical protein [Anaerolineaceae bacterium]